MYVQNEQSYHWVNTNRLLGLDGITGSKTGITEAAGACLATTFEKDGNYIIVVLLQCKSMDARWEEAQLLIDWAVQRKMLMTPIPSSAGNSPPLCRRSRPPSRPTWRRCSRSPRPPVTTSRTSSG